MESIAVVIVTFNRLFLLKDCVKTLQSQTRKLDAIIVVNNGSTDGTKEWLDSQADLITYNQENLGGSGGFYRGMKEAVELGYEWIWIVDDDAFPENVCLEKLSDAIIKDSTIKVIAPLVVEDGNINELHRGRFNNKGFNFPIIQQPILNTEILNSNGNIIEIDFISFIGMLIHKKVIDKIGLPRTDYFIFHDDVEYSLRIKKAGIKLSLLPTTCIYHKVNDNNKSLNITSILLNRSAVNNIKKKNIIRFRKRKNYYFDVNLFYCFGRRNSLINIATYFEVSRQRLYWICVVDFIKTMIRIGFTKGSFFKTILLFESYKQGITKKINNKSFIN